MTIVIAPSTSHTEVLVFCMGFSGILLLKVFHSVVAGGNDVIEKNE
jgi:hypothetical protein